MTPASKIPPTDEPTDDASDVRHVGSVEGERPRSSVEIGIPRGARESRPERAWPISTEPRMSESIVAPRPSHAPKSVWTLDAALRAAAELEADLQGHRSEQAMLRAFADAMAQIFVGLQLVVRVFEGTDVAWTMATAALATPFGGCPDVTPETAKGPVFVSQQALSRARLLSAALPSGDELSRSGVVLPVFTLSETPVPVTEGAAWAVDALVLDAESPIAVVALESPSLVPLEGLEPVLSLMADKLGVAMGRLRSSESADFLRRYLQEMFEHASGPIVAIAPDRTIRAVNEPALRLLGRPRQVLIGLDFTTLIRDDEDRGRLASLFAGVLTGQPAANVDFKIRRLHDGIYVSTRWNTATILGADGRPGAIVAMGEDLSDVQRLEQQIIHAEKLATLGQLAAGVLHELNNPLTSITVYSDYLLQKARRGGGDAGDAEKLARISDAAARMTRFTRDLVTYARPSSDTKASVSMIDVLEQSLGFCEHVLDEGGVLVERNYGHDLPRIEAVQGQLHQVFVNLITNACQAMSTAREEGRRSPDSLAGKITRTSKLLVLAERVDAELVVRISDAGPGIAPEHLSKIFEPFFTTKREGKGTGLGLSIVRNLVVHNGGVITAQSHADVGTTFEIRFAIR